MRKDDVCETIARIIIITPFFFTLFLIYFFFIVVPEVDKRNVDRNIQEFTFECEQAQNGKVITSPNGNLYCKK